MNVKITPGKAKGTVVVPPSKSMAHRLLICAGLSEGKSVIRGISDCEDVQATLDCLRALGARCEQIDDMVTVWGVDPRCATLKETLRCRESGSTLRFLIPVLLLTKEIAVFEGYGRLMERPMSVYENICKERGLTFFRESGKLTVGGGLPFGTYMLPGNVSSQFVSGLLFALPMAEGESVIELIPPVESSSYINMTLDAMRRFGVFAEWDGDCRLRIAGNQKYMPQEETVEGDYSNAAFLDALNFLGGEVALTGLREDSLQGDRCYREAMEALCRGEGTTVSLGDCPDLGPILFSIAAAKHGGVFTETARLRIKESDRVECMRLELEKLGVKMEVEEDRVRILKGELTPPRECLYGHNDHRIVMSLAVLITMTGGEISGAEAVRKSYPSFFSDLAGLGIEIEEISSFI